MCKNKHSPSTPAKPTILEVVYRRLDCSEQPLEIITLCSECIKSIDDYAKVISTTEVAGCCERCNEG